MALWAASQQEDALGPSRDRQGAEARRAPASFNGALYRFHLRVGVDATAESAKLLLQAISALPRHEFWPDDASYLDLPTAGIIGHKQVTDAYLAFLAQRHGATLLTMDQALAAIHPGATLLS